MKILVNFRWQNLLRGAIIKKDMPPKDNTNKNTPEPAPFKVGLDPVFQNNNNRPVNTPTTNDASGIADVLTNQAYQPNKIIDYTKPKVSLNENTNMKKSVVRTFKDDMADAISQGHLSSVNIAIAEQQKQQKAETVEPVSAPSEYSKHKIITLISIILLLLGGSIIAFVVLNTKKTEKTPIVITPEWPSFITTEHKNEFNISGMDQTKILTTLSNGIDTIKIPTGNFYNVYLTSGTSTSRRLLNSKEMVSLLKFKMPDSIKRNLNPLFMVGMYYNEKNNPFVIFKVSSFENAYAGMLEWEAELERDFQILFRLPGYEEAGSLLSDLKAVEKKKFRDAVILNKDVRLIKDENNQIILLYSIIDKETIVITTSDTAFKVIIDRLNKEKTLKR
jgi:hypothetical protein